MSLVRYGFYEGTLRAGSEAAFYEMAERELLPVVRRFPGSTEASILRPIETDAGAPSFVLGVRVAYPDIETCHAALQSPVRADARAVASTLLEMFEGKVHHYNFEDIR